MDPTQTATDTAPSNTGALGPRQAADAIMGALPDIFGTSEPDEQEEAATGGEPSEAEATADESADEGDGAEDGAEAEEGEGEESEAEEPEALIEVTVDGEPLKVTLEELRKGYSRTADYTRKTMALADQRKALAAEAEATKAERSEYGELLPKLREMISGAMGKEPDWDALRAANPAEYSLRYADWQRQTDALKRVEGEQARIAEATQREQQEAQRAFLQQQQQEALKHLKHWSDPKVAARESDEIAQLMLQVGFGEEELAIYDHRALRLAHMALQYAKSQGTRQQAATKVKAAPVIKPGGGVPKKGDPKQTAFTRLAKTGDQRDAAAWFRANID